MPSLFLLRGIFTVELSLLVGVVTSFILGALLLLIKVPNNDNTRKLWAAKRSIVVCYFLCTLFMTVALYFSGTANYPRLVSLVMFVITAETTVILSAAMMNVLEEGFIDRDKYHVNLVAVYTVGFFLIRSFWWDNFSSRTTMLIICGILFFIQCILHSLYFIKVYRKCSKALSMYYDEDEDKRLRKVKFCYVLMMLTQVFILVYLALPSELMLVWIFWYSLFQLYFMANFLSYVGSHKFVVEAFAYKTLSGQELMRKINEIQQKVKGHKAEVAERKEKEKMPGFTTNDSVRLEKALERWVEAKKYCELDQTREEIAKELRTTKEFLQLYFTTKVGMDFRTWRTQLRVEEAKRLLLVNKEASIQIIAEASGFSDKSNFHRQFVKMVGCSPKEWRDSDGKPSLD